MYHSKAKKLQFVHRLSFFSDYRNKKLLQFFSANYFFY